jgi:hypothetical protein
MNKKDAINKWRHKLYSGKKSKSMNIVMN